jgi:hypothetical protein
MASKSYEGNFKAWILTAAPAGLNFAAGGSVITAAELTAGTRLLRLPSDGGVTYSYTQNTASQALVDKGKVSHNVGTREITGLSITHEIDFPLSTDAMFALYDYGDTVYLVVSPDGEPTTTGEMLDIFQIETGEAQKIAPSRDTKQNFMVGCAVQDWDLTATFSTP